VRSGARQAGGLGRGGRCFILRMVVVVAQAQRLEEAGRLVTEGLTEGAFANRGQGRVIVSGR